MGDLLSCVSGVITICHFIFFIIMFFGKEELNV